MEADHVRNVHGQQIERMAWGKWFGSLESLTNCLQVFIEQQQRASYGNPALSFILLENGGLEQPYSKGWMAAPFDYKANRLISFEMGENEGYLDTVTPYAELTTREGSDFLKVEFWHNGRCENALFPFLYALGRALVEDGLEAVQVEKQPHKKNFYARLDGKPPFAEGEKANQLVERSASGVKGEVSKDDGEETAVSARLPGLANSPLANEKVYEYYDVNLNNFRGLISSLDRWRASTGEYLVLEERFVTRWGPINGILLDEIEKYLDPTRARWAVKSSRSDNVEATIDAYEIGERKTKVKFTDGFEHSNIKASPPIGLALHEFAQYLYQEISDGAKERIEKVTTGGEENRASNDYTQMYPGSLIHFRAYMGNFMIRGSSVRTVNSGERLHLSYDSRLGTETTDYWDVGIYAPVVDGKSEGVKGRATIAAFESEPGRTQVKFIDGLHTYSNTVPIGPIPRGAFHIGFGGFKQLQRSGPIGPIDLYDAREYKIEVKEKESSPIGPAFWELVNELLRTWPRPKTVTDETAIPLPDQKQAQGVGVTNLDENEETVNLEVIGLAVGPEGFKDFDENAVPSTEQELMIVRQTFFGLPAQFVNYIMGISLDDGYIAPAFDNNNLAIVRLLTRPYTPEEKAAAGIPEYIERLRNNGLLKLGEIEINPVGEKTVWESFSQHPDGIRYILFLAEIIKQARLGSDPIIIQFTPEEGRRIVTNTADIGQLEPKNDDTAGVGQGDAGGKIEPKRLIEPKPIGEGGTREEWYQYKYDCDQAKWKYTFKDLAKELNLKESTLRKNYYPKWLDKMGLKNSDEK